MCDVHGLHYVFLSDVCEKSALSERNFQHALKVMLSTSDEPKLVLITNAQLRDISQNVILHERDENLVESFEKLNSRLNELSDHVLIEIGTCF